MNRACIQRTIFINHSTGEKSFGYRIYDDHGQTYCNILDEKIFDMSHQDFLNHVEPTFDDVADSIYIDAMLHGIYVDDQWYHFDLKAEGGPKLCSPNKSD